MTTVKTQSLTDDRGLLAYQVLRAAVDLYGRQPGELNGEEMKAATVRANQAQELETLVLQTPNGQRVFVPEVAVDDAVKRIQDRFEDEASFERSLLESGVKITDLRRALWRELAFDAVISMIGDDADVVTDQDIETYYHQHQKSFHRPEHRTARHILITINDDYDENTNEQAWKRALKLAEELKGSPDDFADQATQNSECPSALEGGLLGSVPAGKLYPELDRILFTLKEGEVAGPIETEVGLHVILCEKIEPASTIALDDAQEKLRAFLTQKNRKARQKEWIASLKSPT
jgi:peptidyl-prolyl cis-trans isomerase C